jgi:hypothetical protein
MSGTNGINGTNKVTVGGVERVVSPLVMDMIRGFSKRDAAARRGELDEDAIMDLQYDKILASLNIAAGSRTDWEAIARELGATPELIQKHTASIAEATKDQIGKMAFPAFKRLLASVLVVSELETQGGAERLLGISTGPTSTGG